eukprot:TRINITY_DN6893_c0_g1_i1.p1 TRINITY_DN6893_c0_g1~~TRINITY_DN6893_c0_g1_i1.p1  ORF type:complete len:58 (-),score=3.10 TRINITY_DN6893_c0_g1_i1:4-177(-)
MFDFSIFCNDHNSAKFIRTVVLHVFKIWCVMFEKFPFIFLCHQMSFKHEQVNIVDEK